MVVEVVKSGAFAAWLSGLRDRSGRARILVRIDVGPGYRIYLTNKGRLGVVLLAGGDKSTQAMDIANA